MLVKISGMHSPAWNLREGNIISLKWGFIVYSFLSYYSSKILTKLLWENKKLSKVIRSTRLIPLVSRVSLCLIIEDGWCWALQSLTVLRLAALQQISVCHYQSPDHHHQPLQSVNEEGATLKTMKFCDCWPFILLWIMIGLFGTQAIRPPPQQPEGEKNEDEQLS